MTAPPSDAPPKEFDQELGDAENAAIDKVYGAFIPFDFQAHYNALEKRWWVKDRNVISAWRGPEGFIWRAAEASGREKERADIREWVEGKIAARHAMRERNPTTREQDTYDEGYLNGLRAAIERGEP